MTIITSITADSLTDGNGLTVDAPWSMIGATPNVSAAAAIHGANGIRWSTTSASGRVQYDFGSNQAGAIVISFYFKINTMATANLYLARIYSLPTGGTPQGDFRVNTNGTVAIRNGNVAIATSTPTLSAGTVYRAEWRTNVTSTTQELRIYTGESTSPYITLTGAWSTATARTWAFGPADAAATGAIDYDTIKIADDWTGPEVISNPTVTATVGDYSRIIASTTNGTAPFTYSIAQLTGTTTAPIDVSNGVWLVQRSATETLTYRITVTDATSTTDDYDISVLPVTAATAWPKKPTSVGTTSWA